MIKSVVITLLVIGAILEFVKIEPKSRRVSLRKEVSANLAGTIFGIIAVLIWLFG